MKYLGVAKQILRMIIVRDGVVGTLKLAHKNYTRKILEKLYIIDAKIRRTPWGSQIKLSKKQSPKKDEGREEMAKIRHASSFDSLIYTMVCTRLDITHVVRVVNRSISNLGKEH